MTPSEVSAPIQAAIAEERERTRRLPTFQQMRRDAQRELGDVLDGMRSDWADGCGPTAQQAKAFGKARELIALAKAHLDRAAR